MSGANYGVSVDVSDDGSTIAVGAQQEGTLAQDGVVYIYSVAALPNVTRVAKLQPTFTGGIGFHFGASVALR